MSFRKIAIAEKEQNEEIIRQWNVAKDAEKVVFSVYVEAVNPTLGEVK